MQQQARYAQARGKEESDRPFALWCLFCPFLVPVNLLMAVLFFREGKPLAPLTAILWTVLGLFMYGFAIACLEAYA